MRSARRKVLLLKPPITSLCSKMFPPTRVFLICAESAPEFSLRTVEGKKLSLSDYKGKAVLINFWATWCAPCKIEMPWLVALHSQYAPQGFEILGVSEDDADTPRAKLAKFGHEQGLNYPLLVGDDAVSRKYGGVEFLPTSYFVGRDGKIVAETAGLVAQGAKSRPASRRHWPPEANRCLRLTAIVGLVCLAASGQVIKDQPLPLPDGADQRADAARCSPFPR